MKYLQVYSIMEVWILFIILTIFLPIHYISGWVAPDNKNVNTSTCPPDQFQCDGATCIPDHWRCDSHVDCKDSSDESNCEFQTCRPRQFQCYLTHKCLPVGWMCDGEPDCGTHHTLGLDLSDEYPSQCHEKQSCSWNEARCGDTIECRHLRLFCDGHGDCPDNSDEWDFCQNKTQCDQARCLFGCKPTPNGPMCFCSDGYKPEGSSCVDADECELENSCAQICKNTVGSFECSCVAGYNKQGTDCIAVNVPESEPASLIFTTKAYIKRVTLDGKPWPGNSTMNLLNSNALEFSHLNRTICYIHHNVSKASFICADVDNFTRRWEMGKPSIFPEVDSIQQIALDWISGNWYFMDDLHDILLLCSSSLIYCRVILEKDLNKPRALALDPTRGYLFFTKWGQAPPMLERSRMDGSERKSLVRTKIVYPYGVAVDYATGHVYWVDTYLDYVERIDNDGKNRKTVMRGFPVQNLYGVSVFESRLYVSSWHNHTILELNKVLNSEKTIFSSNYRPYNLHVFHKQKQPDVAHPCRNNNGGCPHMCVTNWNRAGAAVATCVCAAGYLPTSNGQCSLQTPSTFLLIVKSKPASIVGISPRTKLDVIVPITNVIHAAGLDYYAEEKSIIYFDMTRLTIERVLINNVTSTTILDKGIAGCEGLAVDWMSENLYYTDEGLGTISVLSLRNTSRGRVLVQNPRMHPLSISLDPKRGMMYWADWYPLSPTNGSIYRAWMDGTHMEKFISDDIHWPSGLTLDLVGKKLYWTDAHLKRIESIELNGKNRRVELDNNLESPFGLTLFNRSLYFTEYAKGNVMVLHLDNRSVEAVIDGNGPLHQIKMYDPKSQVGVNTCKIGNHTCAELCLPTPNGVTCACSRGYSPKNGTCIEDEQKHSSSNCDSDHFACKSNGLCVQKKNVCDGVTDCPDGSDEMYGQDGPCKLKDCPSNHFRCDGSVCLANYWVCDGDKDCLDGTDEDPKNCQKQCQNDQFSCNISKRCIPSNWKCDGVVDCGVGDNSDEVGCEAKPCNDLQFTCNNKNCISLELFCDGIDNCNDNSDEVNCAHCDPAKEFYCAPTVSCINNSLKCNGEVDCPDSSDEMFCSEYKRICEEHEFACGSDECILKKFQCDGRIDCENGFDEYNCSKSKIDNATIHSTTMSPLSIECDHPNRLCDNNTKCLPVDRLCNEVEDCADGSDEGLRCSEHLCAHTFMCSDHCHDAPEGLVCYCPPGAYLQPDQATCSHVSPCEEWGTCSQLCHPKKSSYKCACHPGYTLLDDGFTCRSNDPATPFVIFSNRHELRSINLHILTVKALISSLKNTIAVDFYHSNDSDLIFWTDIIDDKIYRGMLVGGILSNIEVVVQTGLSTAEGLAVDWIGNNLYWVESNLDQIEVARLNGSFRRTLVAGDMESPRAIALDPRDGLLFWTDWDNSAPRIEKCTLAGLDREWVIRVDKIPGGGGWPNGLTLDYDARRIYWIDARSDSIHTTKYDGSDLRKVLSEHGSLSHPFAITLYENYVYWTDWRSNIVVRANKWTGRDVVAIHRTLTQPFDVLVLHPSRQPRGAEPSPCETNNAGCSHLCLLHSNNTYRCDCPHIMRLDVDNRTCVVNERVLLIARSNEIRGVDLSQPHYYMIPTISVPQVLNPTQIDFLSKSKTLYWADSQISEIKRTGLTSGPAKTLIDTGILHPNGLAIDWLSNLLFISSTSGIKVCYLDGEYITKITGDSGIATSLVVDPPEGKLYRISLYDTTAKIERSSMDGSHKEELVTNLSMNAKSLCIDFTTRRLYWINDHSVYFSDIDGKHVEKLNISNDFAILAIAVYREHIYYAEDDEQSIHVADKTTGADDRVVRNSTSNVLSLRIYDPDTQKGTHPCGKDRGGCQHLCLPTSATEYVCKCAIGFKMDENDPKKCVGYEDFLVYSINWEICGLPLDGNNETEVLGPISRVFMATAIDFSAKDDRIFWTDSDHSTVKSIRRDGTNRSIILEQTELMDTISVDWLTGLAVDWAAGNMYWTDVKRDVIEVSRLNGSSRYVVLYGNIGKNVALAVDPAAGLLLWGGGTKLERAGLDGSNRKLLLNNSVVIGDVALDYDNEYIYWCDSHGNTIERMRYDGSERTTLLNQSLVYPIALTLYNDTIYWIDRIHEGGSIKSAPIANLSNYQILLKNQDSLKDIQVFSHKRQNGTNACAQNNGGCQHLCLFNGTHPVCACPHGYVGSDGKTCKEYESFVMYSRVGSIDSIDINDENMYNSPYPSIKNSSLMRNAIALAYDYEHDLLFYSDIQRGSINSVYFNGSGHSIIVEKQGSVEGLAFEEVNRALYWTCNNEATINKVNLTKEGKKSGSVETIIRLSHLVDRPRGIAVDSCRGRVYWTNWNSQKPSIDRAFLTGFGSESIITTDIRMPNAITLDHYAHHLYWSDARLDKIERCQYDGSHRVVLVKVIPQHPFAIAIYKNYLFWTDWVLHAVLRANKLTGQDVVWLRKDVAKPMGIVAVANDTDDCLSNPCLTLNGGCEELCTYDTSEVVRCACMEGRVLAEDGKRCYSERSSNCTDESFRCSDGGCVPFQLTCDGIAHCADSSDEEAGYCGHRTCPLGWFQCLNKRCVFKNVTCDGENDCGDDSDEINCSCSDENHFKCGSGECRMKHVRCNRNPDCKDISDEIDCPPINCAQEMKDANMINCNRTTACIHKNWICDGENDCWDFSDEQNCTHTCQWNEFRCLDGRCLPHTVKCNSVDDCKDGKAGNVSSDEAECNSNYCESHQFICQTGTCIPLHLRCNGIPDCEDGSDELECKNQCRSDQFRCDNGDCIPISWECDSKPDCRDMSDEHVHCPRRSCGRWEFRCNSTGRCIPKDWVCDGEADCPDFADEHESRGCPPVACLADQFQCNDRHCINQQFHCDGDMDCIDGSDESPLACGKNSQCTPRQFKCANGKCVPRLKMCDERDDCGDNSDETDESCQKNLCEESKGRFQCKNGVCVNDTMLCDGINDCGDFSDESKCNINECTSEQKPCAQICVDERVGYKCMCNDGYRVSPKDNHLCEDINECEDRPCSQKCRNTLGSYLCSCVDGYIMRSDQKSCRANSSVPAKLMLANRYYIRELTLDGHSTLIAHNLTNAVALDFDLKSRCIFWSDVTVFGGSIRRLCTDAPDATTEILHKSALQNPDGLAVDWIGRNLYWCDKGLDTIEVSTLEGKFRRVLISEGLDEPRAIALDPIRGNMYWTDWGVRVHIGKAGMDGSNPHMIVNSSLGWPNALTIAYDTQELFWADAREDYIAVSDLDGKNAKIIVSRSVKNDLPLHHVFAIAVWEDYVYWTDWETKSIEKCLKYSGDNCSSLYFTVHRPMDLRVVHPLRQIELENNPCLIANCSALCLLKPNAPFYTCACPENYELASDGRSCTPNCTTAHFECKNTYKCIPFWWKCDTQDDCGDGSDEPADCRPFKCLPGQFQCDNEQCVHPSMLCDGTNNCHDNSDEVNCRNYTCLNNQFRCEGDEKIPPRCIDGKKRCDKLKDCLLGEDEADCPPASCSPNQFKCANDKCVPAVWVCDGDNDCGDKSDEMPKCQSRTCPPDQFRCNSGRCIPMAWRCDGDSDCYDEEDEPPTCSQPEFHTCDPTYFKCANNKCIPGRWRCDFDNDCGDGSDEVGCTPRKCSESEFRCTFGRCIRGSLKCDGEFQCEDQSDEVDCPSKCGQNEFQCTNPKYCIYIKWKCDGETDCPDGSDEVNCSDACSENEFKCDNGLCINHDWRCDGHDDCEDGSDENSQLCASSACPPGRLRCSNNLCVPLNVVCDGNNDCGDNSDEEHSVCLNQKKCGPHYFQCKNGKCIESSLRCDKENDCEDNSDEVDCEDTVCRWKTCSQLCVERKAGHHVCKCVSGYHYDAFNGSCKALGEPGKLVLAAEAELRVMSPYKWENVDQEYSKPILATAPGYKVDSIDVLYGLEQMTVYWTDHQNKRVQSVNFTGYKTNNNTRVKRDSNTIRTVLSGLKEPRGIAVDWVAYRLYIADGSRILVSDLEGKRTYTLAKEVQQPRDVVVAPVEGLVFWTDWGPPPKIEVSYMDGNRRKTLVNEGVLWPTGIAIDYPAKRLYWTDAKAATIESVKFDGTDRHIVRKFLHKMRPYKIEVFEDNIYMSTYQTHNVFRMDKFGSSDLYPLAQRLPRLSHLLIVQENRQTRNVTNRCDKSCNKTEFCLLSTGGATCTCADGFVKDNMTCRASNTVVSKCSLNCNSGVCKISPGQAPKCVCPQLYTGPHCEHYRCSQYCRNKGMCYPDLLSSHPDGEPVLRCNCPPQWTGERCETPVNICKNWCHNNGTCYSVPLNPARCNCKPGYTGNRCQDCIDVECLNEGVCRRMGGKSICDCAPGFNGDNCSIVGCDWYCQNGGTCYDGPVCVCSTGYTGRRCEKSTTDECRSFCQNDGKCRLGSKGPECECPVQFGGQRCEIDMCSRTNDRRPKECDCDCKNNATCHQWGDRMVCQCNEVWGGKTCEVYMGHDNPCKTKCLNGGLCQIEGPRSIPICLCPESWSGDSCEVPVKCHQYCKNQGTCSVDNSSEKPYCACLPDFEGTQCEVSLSEKSLSAGENSESSLLLPLIFGIGILLIIIGAASTAYIIIKRRRPFLHERLQENDFNNPIYQERDTEPFTLDADKSGNFANPLYESVFNGTGSVKDEKTGLLQNRLDEIPPLTNEDV